MEGEENGSKEEEAEEGEGEARDLLIINNFMAVPTFKSIHIVFSIYSTEIDNYTTPNNITSYIKFK